MKTPLACRIKFILVFGLTAVVGTTVPAWAHGITERVSVGPGGVQGNGTSDYPAISADGRFVAFQSDATNLVPGDTNFLADVFVRDRQTGTTQRVSLGPGGRQGNGSSVGPAISADGRVIAFVSNAPNLVPGDTNGMLDVFVRDRQTGTTRRVSLGQGGVQSNGSSFTPALSADGRFVAFQSAASNLVPGDTNGQPDVFVFDRKTGTTHRVNVGPGGVQAPDGGSEPALSANGRFVAFTSYSSNLVPGDTNFATDVFVRDRQTGTTRRVNLGPGGVEGDDSFGSARPAISADGRFVAFNSYATNLVPGDTNGLPDVFVRDRQTRTTRRVSLGPGRRRRRWVQRRRGGDLGGRTVRRLPLDRHQPGAGRHQFLGRRVHPRPPDGHDPAREPGAGRRRGRLGQRQPGDLGGREHRRLLLGGHQPGAGRHQRRGRRFRSDLDALRHPRQAARGPRPDEAR